MSDQNFIDKSQKPYAAVQWADSTWFRWFLVTAIALGIIFRLSGLGNKIISHDEVYTLLYATGRVGGEVYTSLWDGSDKTPDEVRKFLQPGADNHIVLLLSHSALYQPHQAPLFFVLEHYWMMLFGDTPAAIRGLAALFGLLSIPAMYWLGYELFQSRRAGLISMALLAVSPFHILFAQDARPYSLWALITMVSSSLLIRVARTDHTRAWMQYSLSLIIGLYTHQLFLLVAVAQGIYFAGISLSGRGMRYRGYLSACLLAFAAYAPWLYFMVTGWQAASVQMDVLGMQTTLFRYVQRWLLLFSSPLIDLDFNSDFANLVPYALRGLMMAFLAYCLLFLLKHASKHEKLFIFSIYVVTTVSLISLDLLFGGIRSTTGRYFVPAGVATVLVTAQYLSARLNLSTGKAHSQSRLLAGLLLFAGAASNINILLTDTWWTKELSRVQPEMIREINRDGTLLIVSGSHPTNLGDVLVIGLEVDADVRFRLYEDPGNVDFTGGYANIYWFPASVNEVLDWTATGKIETTEVVPNTLWKVVDTTD